MLALCRSLTTEATVRQREFIKDALFITDCARKYLQLGCLEFFIQKESHSLHAVRPLATLSVSQFQASYDKGFVGRHKKIAPTCEGRFIVLFLVLRSERDAIKNSESHQLSRNYNMTSRGEGSRSGNAKRFFKLRSVETQNRTGLSSWTGPCLRSELGQLCS